MAESTDPSVPSIPIPPPAALEPTPVVPPAATPPGYYSSATPAPASPYVPFASTGSGFSAPAHGSAPAPAYGSAAAQQQGIGQPQGLAIASMVCGIVGIVLFAFLPALAAVIIGHIASRKQPWARGFWITGLITGYIGTVISAFIGLLWIFAIVLAAIDSSAGSTF